MPVLVTNNTGGDYILPNRLLIPDGASVVLSDTELEWIPLEKRDAALLDVTALTGATAGSAVYDTLIDDASASTSYIGEAAPDSPTGSAVWRIKRIYESGTLTTIRYADGVETFTKVWNSRAGYDYS